LKAEWLPNTKQYFIGYQFQHYLPSFLGTKES